MGRIAGDSPGYQFRLCRETKFGYLPTEHGFEFPSVSTFIKGTLGIPAGAMSWSGYRTAIKGVAEFPGVVDAGTPELIEAKLKEVGWDPNKKLSEAGERGTKAHEVLELVVNGERGKAGELALKEYEDNGTHYGHAALDFFDEQIVPGIQSGSIMELKTEVPVWSLKDRYCGTFDLAVLWSGEGWEILDAKTHKPASGFTKPGKGAGYISDATQIRAYRMAFEEMGLGQTFGQRTVVLRENGKYLMDEREVSEDFVRFLRRLYDERQTFERGDE